MGQPYVGEIRLFAGNFNPNGWEFCNGQTLSIAQFEVLFVLIGTTYGGDGITTFALPNLQSRVPVHQGTNSFGTPYALGQNGGVESVTLSTNQIPSHTHTANALTSSASTTSPTENLLAAGQGIDVYSTQAPDVAMAPGAIGVAGGSQPHNNLQPYLSLSFIISLFGVFPTQN